MKFDKMRVIFGRAVRQTREARNMSQNDLANIMGVTQVTIHHIESGKRRVSLDQAVFLSRMLGISLDKLPFKIKVSEED
jgi:transcriptional regulator with XRE-family HTH domain